VMHEHMKGWVAAGHNVTLFSSRSENAAVEEAIDGIHIVRQGYQYWGVQIAGFFYYLKNRQNFDLIVDQFHGIPFFTPLYVHKPILAVIQETTREVWFLNPLPKPLDWLIGIIGYFGEFLLFPPYKNVQFMTGSDSAKNDVAKFGIPMKNITVVQHGIIIKKPMPFPAKEKKSTIVFLGVLSKDKGIEEALKCFAMLSKKGNYQFWVIGRPETNQYGKYIEQMAKNFGLNKKVTFWGFVNQDKKFELLAKAHILVNPSVREGWGLVNIEANSMGTPVVAYESRGLVDSVLDGRSGILCKDNKPEKLAAEICNALTNHKKYLKMQDGAYRWSKSFSWKKSRGMSLSLLKQIMEKND